MDTLEQNLEALYPVSEDGAEPPGKRIPDPSSPGSSRWVGEMQWRTRRGPAFVLWSLGRPNGALNARYPDGSRGTVIHTMDHGFRRRASGPRRWIYGSLDIEANDVAFHDGVQPTYEPLAASGSNLEAAFARDRDFLVALQDDRFAMAVNHVVGNHAFIEIASGRTWSCSERGAARLVAGLRGLGESYHDYYLVDFEGTWPEDVPERVKSIRDSLAFFEGPISILRKVFPPEGTAVVDGEKVKTHDEEHQPKSERMQDPQVSRLRAMLAEIERQPNRDVYDALRGHLTRLGWRTETEDDRERARTEARQRGVAVLQVIKQMETRPETAMSSWARPILDRQQKRAAQGGLGMFRVTEASAQFTEDEREAEYGRVPHRLDALAIGGKISEEEFKNLSERLSASAVSIDQPR